jgi:hypothetical protein
MIPLGERGDDLSFLKDALSLEPGEAPLILDGGMGTLLGAMGVGLDPELW